MADVYQVLSGFSYGELDPKLQARVDFTAYSRGVKTASNILSIPQGGFTRRFGTKYVATLTATNWKYCRVQSFIYDNDTIYTLVFENNTVGIYLENTLVATVVTTYRSEVLRRLYFCVVENRLIILHPNYAPAQLVRSASAVNVITGIDAANDYITLTNPITASTIYPVTFTTGGALPTTDPQILVNTTYYIRSITALNVRVYNTPTDAAANINYYDIQVAGVGNVVLQNTWTLSACAISNYPAYDFDAFPTYSAAGFTFTPSATTGTLAAPLTITASGNVFTAAMVGGVFEGNDGVVRLSNYVSQTQIQGWTYEAFANANAISGRECFLGEPAWSAGRGYPSCGTFFQERMFLGGSRSIPNGVWGSTINAVYDFDDSQKLDDNAISYYPASGHTNYVKAMTATKSLIIHSNTGNYSTSLALEQPITPGNFALVEQNSDGVSYVVPVDIDNQIIYIDRSANNVKSMAWDIAQSSYMNTNIGLTASHLVSSPIDMDVYSEPAFTDGYFVICVNEDGTMGIYNSLMEQDVKGWTKANTEQTAEYENLITGVDAVNNYLTINTALPVGNVYEITFTTDAVGDYPTTTPQIDGNGTYYARVIAANSVRLYTLESDAEDNSTNYYTITNVGLSVNDMVQHGSKGYFRDMSSGLNRAWVIAERTINNAKVLYLEELSFDVLTDCSVKYDLAVATDTLTGLAHLNGETVQIFADGCVRGDEVVAAGSITIDEEVTKGFVGLKFTSQITTLPVNVITQSGPSIYQDQHIRRVQVHYYDSYGMKIQGFDISLRELQSVVLNQRVQYETGVFEYALMEGWNGFEYTIDIIQEYPLPMTLLAVGYNVEV